MTVFDFVLLACALPLVGVLCYGAYRSFSDPDANAPVFAAHRVDQSKQ
ncbi:MAG: hypothetical protein AAF468_03080 [Pseudomonadota bacterium]